jgi:hypothetical protein
VRRPSCPFCQLTALQLSSIKSVLEQHRVRCYAVSHQVDGLNGFVDRFWAFTDAIGMPSLLVDERSAVFHALGARQVPSLVATDTDVASMDAAVERLRKARPSYSVELEGQNSLLGGVVVIDPTEGVIYQELEEDIGESLRLTHEPSRLCWPAFVLCCVGLARLHSLAGW